AVPIHAHADWPVMKLPLSVPTPWSTQTAPTAIRTEPVATNTRGTPQAYRSSAEGGRGTRRVPVAFHVATTRTPGARPIRSADSSVTSATTGGRLPTVTLARFPTGATRCTGPSRAFIAEPWGSDVDRATSQGRTTAPTGPSASSVERRTAPSVVRTAVRWPRRDAVPGNQFTPANAATNADAGASSSSPAVA